MRKALLSSVSPQALAVGLQSATIDPNQVARVIAHTGVLLGALEVKKGLKGYKYALTKPPAP